VAGVFPPRNVGLEVNLSLSLQCILQMQTNFYEEVTDPRDNLEEDDLLVVTDLKSGYHHIPLHESAFRIKFDTTARPKARWGVTAKLFPEPGSTCTGKLNHGGGCGDTQT